METGGGDGRPASFADYTGPGETNRWIAFIYMQDLHVDSLFATCTTGKVPAGTHSEGGFESGSPNYRPPKRIHKNTSDSLSDVIGNCGSVLRDSMKQSMDLFIESQKEVIKFRNETSKKREVGSPISEIRKRQEEQKAVMEDDTLDPEDKTKILRCLKKIIKKETDRATKYYDESDVDN